MTARERAEQAKEIVMSINLESAKGVDHAVAIIASALADAERAGMERAAKIVERWHIKRGGYTAMAWEIREAYTSQQEAPRHGE